MKYDGKHCPKCGRKLKRSGKSVKCLCGWSYQEKEDNITYHFIYETNYGNHRY
jgi:predicted amidophosphoribosyltransferase